MIVGVDYSSYEAVLCAVPFSGGKPKLAHAVFRPKKATGEAAAIAALGEVARSLDEALTAIGIPPDSDPCVYWIERGFGQSRRADFVLGLFFGAIYSSLHARDPWSPVNAMDIQEWKREITKSAGIGMTKDGRGNGQAKKEIANEACRALLVLVEEDGSDWTADELDAYGVAFTGRRLNAKAATLVA